MEETNAGIARTMPRWTAQAEPCDKALGAELAVTFLLHSGGGELYIRPDPNRATDYAALIGV